MTISRLGILRTSIGGIVPAALGSVQTVRDSFVHGIAPLQTANSGSTAHFIQTFVTDPTGSVLVKSTAQFGIATSPGGSSLPPPKPELDSAEVFEDRARGILDQFAVRLTVSLSEDDAKRSDRVRIYRAELGRASVPRPGFAALMNAPQVAGKGPDIIFPMAQRVDDVGIGNKVTAFVADSPNAPHRSVISPDEQSFRPVVPPQNTNRTTAGITGLLSIGGADRSVTDDLTFYLNRRASLSLGDPSRPALAPGDASGINVLKGSSVSTAGSFVQVSNAMNFTAVGTVSPRAPTTRTVGHVVEMELVDSSVAFGARYAYYAACLGDNGEVGPRSRLVNVSVVRTVPPATPDVLFTITAGVPRLAIKAPAGTSHVEVYRSGRAALLSSVMGTDDSLIVEGPSNKVGEFFHAGDLGLGPDGSTCFVDSDIVPGDKVTYRVYAVDAYGLKSQTPFSCSLRIPAHGDRVPLAIPSLTTEQTMVGQPAIRVTVSVDDPRIVAFKFTRRDVVANERAVHQANQPELFDLGVFGPKRAGSRSGPQPRDLPYPSIVVASAGSASFIDTSVRIDRQYQYGVVGVDVRGNETLLVGARPVGVYAKPTVDPPTNFDAHVVVDGSSPVGVLLTWVPGTSDFSPNHLIDDQDVLAAQSVRSAYQVERRIKDAPFWDAMPATTNSYFLDIASDDVAPPFRPPFVVKGLEYEYRVIGLQSGGFVSPRTDSIFVEVAPPPPTPDVVFTRSTDITVRPLNIVVSWNMGSEFIDHWEVQRASTNKIFGAKIQSMDSDIARSLDYQTVANVTPEASRASGIAVDFAIFRDPTIYVGNRFLVDGNIDPANSYFYRVRSVGKLGNASDWTYAGMSLADYAQDRKLLGTLSDDVKVALADDVRPIETKIVQNPPPPPPLKVVIRDPIGIIPTKTIEPVISPKILRLKGVL